MNPPPPQKKKCLSYNIDDPVSALPDVSPVTSLERGDRGREGGGGRVSAWECDRETWWDVTPPGRPGGTSPQVSQAETLPAPPPPPLSPLSLPPSLAVAAADAIKAKHSTKLAAKCVGRPGGRDGASQTDPAEGAKEVVNVDRKGTKEIVKEVDVEVVKEVKVVNNDEPNELTAQGRGPELKLVQILKS